MSLGRMTCGIREAILGVVSGSALIISIVLLATLLPAQPKISNNVPTPTPTPTPTPSPPTFNGTDGAPLNLGTTGFGIGRVPSVIRFSVGNNTPILHCGPTPNFALQIQNVTGPTPLFQSSEISNLFNFNLPPISTGGTGTAIGGITPGHYLQINSSYLYGTIEISYFVYASNTTLLPNIGSSEPYVLAYFFVQDDISTDFMYIYDHLSTFPITAYTPIAPPNFGDSYVTYRRTLMIPHDPLRTFIRIQVGAAQLTSANTCLNYVDAYPGLGVSHLILHS